MSTTPHIFRSLAEMADFMDARADQISAQVRAMLAANKGKQGGGQTGSHRLAGAAVEARMLADMLRHTEIVDGPA